MSTAILDGEVIDHENDGGNELMEISVGETMLAQTKAEIDVAISTAKAYPRNVKRFRQKCEELATVDDDTAATMFYSLPRSRRFKARRFASRRWSPRPGATCDTGPG